MKSIMFKHAALRKLSQDQKDTFQATLDRIVSDHKKWAPFEGERRRFTNGEVRREMEKLLTHLNYVCAASGPKTKFGSSQFWGGYIGFKASGDDRKAIAGFPKMVELMRRIIADSITSKSYKIRPLSSELPCIITMQAAQLLRQYGISPTVTVNGAWFALTKYILESACGRLEETENIRNYLKRVIGYF